MPPAGDRFVPWAMSDAHVGSDLGKGDGRRSLAEAIEQSEGSGGFDWDIALNLGDFSGTQTPPGDAEGREIVKQYGALKKHRREQVYDLVGNHDASGPSEPQQWWFKKWLDPAGDNTAHSGVDARRRPFPIDGTWERYSFEAGNLLFLMMGDRNDGGPPVGRDEVGGYPAGAISSETFEWWRDQLASNRDKIVISAHHHMLKETTVGSADWEGVDNLYHGRFERGAPIGASYLYWVGGQPDTGVLEGVLADAHDKGAPAMDLWLGAHTHAHPDDEFNGRSHVEKKWGVNFVNVAALTRWHMDRSRTGYPMSRVFEFTDGSPEVRVRCYLHTSQVAPRGWYAGAERTLKLRHAFQSP
ncbi:MAG: metallophosphoesterase [Chloroflexi bacterium]|nr:metallophosphoesterase [Chloroflexota bacterium]